MPPIAFDWTKMKKVQKIHRFLYAVGFGPLIGKIILLLTTTGRKSGLPRITPLQYEVIDGGYYLGSARGTKSDWFRNILADNHVEVRVKARHFHGTAETVTDPARVADFLAYRLERHPLMIGLMMKMYNLPMRPSREQLLELSQSTTLVIIHP